MCKSQDVLFQSPLEPYQFSAIGYVLGSFQPQPDSEIKSYIPGIIVTKEGVELIASIHKKHWQKLTLKKVPLDEQLYWRVYFRTTKEGTLTKINLIKPTANPDEFGSALFTENFTENPDIFQVRGRLQQIFKNAFSVRLERNDLPPAGKEDSYLWKPFYLTIQGNLPSSATPEQFWEILCTRDRDYLSLKQATLITEEMVLAWEISSSVVNNTQTKSRINTQNKKEKTDKLTQDPSLQSSQEQPIKESKIIMLNGKQPEIVVKFTERPELPKEGKKVTLQITGENGIVVMAELNRKTLAKQVEKMDTSSGWVGALSGKVASISPDGVVILETAGVQVFERKDKSKLEEKSDSVA